MNKEDILNMSSNENKGKADERELQILSNASRIGMAVGGLLAVIIVIFSEIIDQPLIGLSAWAIYFSMYAGLHLYSFIHTKERSKLIQAIIGIIVGLACFIGLIILGLQK